MRRTHDGLRLLTISLLCTLVGVTEGWSQAAYRLPTYPAAEPPPLRTQEEVRQLLARSAADGVIPEPAAPMQVVLVAGPKDHGDGEHDYPAWQTVWSRLLAQAPHTRVDTAWEFPSAEQLAHADVVVFYQRGSWDDARAQGVDGFLAKGGGLVYIHWAVDGQGREQEMAQRIGLACLSASIRYRHGELDVDLSPGADHPIARNFGRVRWVDESYWRLTGDPTRIQLLGTSLEDGQPWPQFWTVQHATGRVFVSIPGHYMWTFDDPTFRTLLLRGIAWSGHRDVDRFNSLVTLDARVAQ